MMHFLLDGMLGKLARWLRMIGYEATYRNDYEDSDLLSLAKRDALTLLTSDQELYRTAIGRGIDCFLVEGRTEAERLAALANRYELDLRIDTAVSRCPICGSPIREVSKSEVKDLVPPATFNVYQTFWVCNNPACGKVYWQGSHWGKIEQTLETAREILENKRTDTAQGPKQQETKPRRRHPASPPSTPSHHKIPRKT
jgi:uncharacterized protein with PIN domain